MMHSFVFVMTFSSKNDLFSWLNKRATLAVRELAYEQVLYQQY
ncbi:hypothetical protein CFter6_4528 [Collimonas fungivorans]|uniref:Uncharacterized protein n=1 Tax=Collimonas fungivorans TaxID=158899 RepID=A0A127PH50_9BURK|nr:hypothetical protein CFter6_4528 [Collimonas fungivorans]